MSANDELQAHTCEKMLEFYGDVANNVAQGKVQGLQTGYDILKEYEAHKTPVPSYDRVCRLNHLENDFIKAHERINKLEKENQQLKELLKQWVHFYPIVLYEYEDTLKTRDIIELYEKTVNATGEKR